MAAVWVKRSIETINAFMLSSSSLKIQTRLQTKMSKGYTHFQSKQAQNRTLLGGTYLYGLYKGVPPPPRPVLTKHNFQCNVKIHPKMPRYLKVARVRVASSRLLPFLV